MSRARRQQYMLRTEASEQEAVIMICKFMENRYPELKLLHHCPNGGKRDRVSAAVLKRQGVKAGVPESLPSWECGLKFSSAYVLCRVSCRSLRGSVD